MSASLDLLAIPHARSEETKAGRADDLARRFVAPRKWDGFHSFCDHARTLELLEGPCYDRRSDRGILRDSLYAVEIPLSRGFVCALLFFVALFVNTAVEKFCSSLSCVAVCSGALL